MSGRVAKRAFAARPGDADTWVRMREAPSSHESEASLFTARLTIDVTPEQRGRIKVTAFQRGQTVADMWRELLAREFPGKDGDPQ
jgi:Ni/Co efflux regulator RcnB